MASDIEKIFGILEPLFLGPLLSGIEDMEEAQRMENALGPPPKYEIPESVDQYEEMMRSLSQRPMPGYDIMKGDIQEAYAADVTGYGQLEDPVSALSGIGGLGYDQANQLRDLGMRAFQWQDEARLGYAGAMQNRIPYENAMFEYNQWLPWQIEKNEIAALRGAGQQAMVSGMDTAGAGAVNMMGNLMNNPPQQQI